MGKKLDVHKMNFLWLVTEFERLTELESRGLSSMTPYIRKELKQEILRRLSEYDGK